MKKNISIAIGLALAFLLGVATLGGPSAAAQTGAQGPSSIAAGPNGMWILHGDKIYVCNIPMVQPRRSVGNASLPPSPQCGTPLTLR